MTVTLGIDLASQPKNTAMCWIEWEPGRASVTKLFRGTTDDNRVWLDDEFVASAMCGGSRGLPAPSKIAIDAPLGWPVDFVKGVTDLALWPVKLGDNRTRLERRATDHWVHQTTGKLPLSVTTDRIAYPAMRAAGLIAHCAARLAPVDRTGLAGVICEAYPDPAIRRLGLWPADAGPRESYKADAPGLRERIMIQLAQSASWLEISAAHQRACIESDDCLDALMCALVARGAERGLTIPPPDGLKREAASEGWIHVPQPGALPHLV
jgi:Protein of unknown function (DUF429)